MLLERTVVCFDCKGSLTEPENVSLQDRIACPQCGSHERAVQVVTAGFIRSSDDLGLDFSEEQNHGAMRSGAVGSSTDEPSQLVVVQREFSPDRNLYIEHVEDEATGVVLWHLESSLTEYVRRSEDARRTHHA